MQVKMPVFSIPPPVRSGFRRIKSLDENQINILSSIIKSIEIGDGVNKIAEKNYEKLSITEAELQSIMGALFSLVNIFPEANNSIEKFASEFSLSFQDLTNEIDEGKTLEANLIILLQDFSLIKKTLKSRELFTDNLNNFSESRVISDVRIIYDDDAELDKKEQFAIVIHNLKIVYSSSANYNNEIYISLDLADLLELQKVISRAIKKDSLIRSNNHELQFLNIK